MDILYLSLSHFDVEVVKHYYCQLEFCMSLTGLHRMVVDLYHRYSNETPTIDAFKLNNLLV